MTPRFDRLCLAVLFIAALSAPAQTPPAPRPAAIEVPDGDKMISELKLPNADIDLVLDTLQMLTGRTILRPAALQTATYNLIITKPLPKSEAIIYIETILALNNIGVTPLGDHALVISQLQLTRTNAPEMLTGSAFDLPPSGQIATKIFQLDFMRVAEFVPMIQTGILNPNLQGLVALQGANAVLVTDSVSNLQRVEALLKIVDRPNTSGLTPKFYPLRNANATALVGKLNGMLGGTLRQQLGQNFTFNADDRTNQIVLFADPRQYATFDDLIAKLDIAADPPTRTDVIYLKHAKAADLVGVLTKLISTQTANAQRANSQSVRPGQGVVQNLVGPPVPGAPAAPTPTVVAASNAGNATEGSATTNEFSSTMTVTNDDRSNSIVVSGTAQDLVLMTRLIDKLDIVLAQVRIEVVIAEVTLDDQSSSGIAALGLKVDGDRLVGFNGSYGSPTSLSISGSGNTTSTDFATISRLGGPGSLGRSLDLVGIINLSSTPRKSNSTILSVPSIVTSHGQAAKFFDGETRPVVTGSTSTPSAATSGSGFSTSSQVTPQQIGTTLNVTPYIGNDGTVQLNIEQKVTDVTGTVTIDNNTQYVIGERDTTSFITAKSGEIIVMGGFRKQTVSKSTSRLGPIPFIGDFFGARTRENKHQELIFFLRPTVLTNTPSDNTDTMKHVDALPTKDDIRREIDPNYVTPKPSVLDKLLGK